VSLSANVFVSRRPMYVMVRPRDLSHFLPFLGIGQRTGFGGCGNPPHVGFLARARSSRGGGGVSGGRVSEEGDGDAAAAAQGRPPADRRAAAGRRRHSVAALFSAPASVASGLCCRADGAAWVVPAHPR